MSQIKLTLQQCTVAVKDIDVRITWFVDWGLDKAIDGIKIVCKKVPVPE